MTNIRGKISIDRRPVEDLDKQIDRLVKQESVAQARALLAQQGADVLRRFNSSAAAARSLLDGPLASLPDSVRRTLSGRVGNLPNETLVDNLNETRQKTDLGNANRSSPNDNKTRIRGKEDNRLVTSQPQRGQSSGTALRSSADNIPVRDNSSVEVEPIGQTGISENVLNNYVNLQYHIVLSMVPSTELNTIQVEQPLAPSFRGQPGSNSLRRSLESDKSIVFAATGEVFATKAVTLDTAELFGFGLQSGDAVFDEFGDILPTNTTVGTTGRNYYNIKSVKFDVVMSPSRENPYINQMLGIKMIVIEPHGFKLHEDMKVLADRIGYSNINRGRIVWRVDIFFSGYDQNTGEWIPQITLDTRSGGRKCTKLTYYQMITKMQAKVDHTGTTYDVDMVPFGHVAYRPEEITVEAESIFAGAEGSNTSKSGTFGGFLKKLETAMEESKKQRTHEQIKRKYRFIAPTQLLEAKFFEDDFASKQGLISNDPEKGNVVAVGKNLVVLDLIESALQDLQFVWDKFLADKDPQFIKPRIHWGVRFNARFENGANISIHDYNTIVLEYIIEPYATYKKASIENIRDAENVTNPTAQLRRIEEMLRLGMVNRIYDYIHTAENTEVIDFDISLKLFYYHALFNYPDNPTASGNHVTLAGSDVGVSKQKKAIQGNVTQIEDNFRVTNRRTEIDTDSALQRIFGDNLDNAPASCFIGSKSNAFDILSGGFNEFPKEDYYGSIASAANRRKAKFHVQFNDHIQNDLMVIDNLQVRGDPIWLLTPYGVESGNTLATQDASKDGTNQIGIVQTQASRILFLRMFAPNQTDYMNPNREFAASSCNVIGGFYEVFRVTSEFEGGKFTQTITGGKINHLNFIENFISTARRDNNQTESVSAEGLINMPPNAQPPEQAQIGEPVVIIGRPVIVN